jgi:hypothetical protein
VRWIPLGQLKNIAGFLHANIAEGEILGTDDNPAGVRGYVWTCVQCGFVRMHATSVLDAVTSEETNDP